MAEAEEVSLLTAYQSATSRYFQILAAFNNPTPHWEFVKLCGELDVARIDREKAKLRLDMYRVATGDAGKVE